MNNLSLRLIHQIILQKTFCFLLHLTLFTWAFLGMCNSTPVWSHHTISLNNIIFISSLAGAKHSLNNKTHLIFAWCFSHFQQGGNPDLQISCGTGEKENNITSQHILILKEIAKITIETPVLKQLLVGLWWTITAQVYPIPFRIYFKHSPGHLMDNYCRGVSHTPRDLL